LALPTPAAGNTTIPDRNPGSWDCDDYPFLMWKPVEEDIGNKIIACL